MTVKELIEHLQKCDQDANVYFDAGAIFYEVSRVTEDHENKDVELG
jgi:hypothetical protein